MISGSYIIRRKGKEDIRFDNLITNTGKESFLNFEGLLLVSKLELSRDPSDASENSTSLVATFLERYVDDYKIKREPNGMYRIQHRFDLFNCPKDTLNKVGIFSGGMTLFSTTRIKDSKGNPISISIEEGEDLVVIYELRFAPLSPSFKTLVSFTGKGHPSTLAETTYSPLVEGGDYFNNLGKSLYAGNTIGVNGISLIADKLVKEVSDGFVTFTLKLDALSLEVSSINRINNIIIDTNIGSYTCSFEPPIDVIQNHDFEYKLKINVSF